MAVWMEIRGKNGLAKVLSAESQRKSKESSNSHTKNTIANDKNDAQLGFGIHLKIKAPSRTDNADIFLKLVC